MHYRLRHTRAPKLVGILLVLVVLVVTAAASGAHRLDDRLGSTVSLQGLRVVSATTTSVGVTWSAASSVGTWTYGVSVDGTQRATPSATSYTLTGLTCGSSYLVAIRAFELSGMRSSPASITVATSPCGTPPPPTTTTPTPAPTPAGPVPTSPGNLRVTSAGTTSVTLAWTASTDNKGVTGYQMYRDVYHADRTTGLAGTITGLTCGTSYRLGVAAFDGDRNESGPSSIIAATSACAPTGVPAPAPTQPTVEPSPGPAPAPPPASPPSAPAGGDLLVSPAGSDANACTTSAPCASLSRAYAVARAGQTVQIAGGSYSSQVIKSRADLRNGTCTTSDTSRCVVFVTAGAVKINGVLEIRGSGILFDGRNQLDVTGYVDTEATSNSDYPDHVVVQNLHSTSFGVFNTDTVTFRSMNVGPASVGAGCKIEQGPGIENKIGFGGDNSFVPRNVTIDGLRIHDQNSTDRAAREAGDCHFGGLFVVTVDGLTVKNTVFERNVVYHVQLQNFGGAPAPQNVLFTGNSFGCAVDWAYFGDKCDNQAAIQFDGAFPSVSMVNNVSAGGLFGCYVGTCGGFAGNVLSSNRELAANTSAPGLP